MNRIYNTVISHCSQYNDNGDVCLSEPSRSGCFYLPLQVKEVNNQNAQPGITGQVSDNSEFCFRYSPCYLIIVRGLALDATGSYDISESIACEKYYDVQIFWQKNHTHYISDISNR